MDADPPAAAPAAKEKEADKPADAAVAADANGAAPPPKEEAAKKSFPRCQLRLRLDSGCYLARLAKGDRKEQEKGDAEKKEKANGNDAEASAGGGDGDKGDGGGDVLLLPQELAAERGWLTDEHAAALERKLVEAASRLGSAAPPLWSLRSERVRRLRIFRRRFFFLLLLLLSRRDGARRQTKRLFCVAISRSLSLR